MKKSVPLPDRYLRAARKMVDLLNTGSLNLYEYKPKEDENGITRFTLTKTKEDIPCRLSYQDKAASTENEPAKSDKAIRVVTSVENEIPEGSIIEITFCGKTGRYKRAGRPHVNDFRISTPLVVYEEHNVQEIYEGGDGIKD